MKYRLTCLNPEPRVSTRADLRLLCSLRINFARQAMARSTWIVIIITMLNGSANAQTDSPATDAKKIAPQAVDQAAGQPFLQEDWKAYQAIHAGNQRLIDGDAATALEAYEHAAQLEPNAPEIPFVQGLAQYAQQDYESARQSFERAATAEDAQLANDALYSLGTTYHAQAFQQAQEDPEAAIASLEQALQRYRMVLDQNPQHEQANDANRKAAAMRRQIREMMQQQEQEQESKDGEESEDQEDQDKENSDSDDQEKGDQDQDQEQQESDEDSEPQDSDKQDESSKDGDEKDQDKEQESESSDSEDKEQEKEQKEQQAKQQQESETSKQAKRQLREMMQDMRDRKKNRKQPVQRMPIKPVEKDW